MKSSSIKLIAFCTLIFCFNSCSDDSPTLDRDKFIGEYDGVLDCKGLLAETINGATTFSIDESSSGDELVDITIQSNPVLRLEATVMERTLDVSTMIPGVMIMGNTFDITANGPLMIDETDTNINGDLIIQLSSIVTISDVCTITGTKK